MFKEFATVAPYLKKYKLNYIVGILFQIGRASCRERV